MSISKKKKCSRNNEEFWKLQNCKSNDIRSQKLQLCRNIIYTSDARCLVRHHVTASVGALNRNLVRAIVGLMLNLKRR